MRIFNEDKTNELSQYNTDFSKGHLENDKLLIAHFDAIEPKIIKSASEIANEYKLQGRQVNLRNDGNWYVTTKIYEGGGADEELIEDIVQEAKDAYDEYEDIQVYVPYTDEQLKTILRTRREKLLSAFDKWEKAVLRGREQDDYIIMAWYRDLLDLKESAFTNIPKRIEYYL